MYEFAICLIGNNLWRRKETMGRECDICSYKPDFEKETFKHFCLWGFK
jgi:hypothetical protein